MHKTTLNSFTLLIIGLTIFFSSIFVMSLSLSSAKLTHNTVTLSSKWTWDTPYLDGTLESLWSISPSNSYSIFSREGGNQTFYLQFLNNKDYLFIAITWSDNEVVQGDSLRFYFDESHDGVLKPGAEDCQLISRSLSMWSLTDRHFESGIWVNDVNHNSSLGWSSSPTRIEVQIPIGNNAEEFDLNSTFSGDLVGFNIIATDSDFIESIPGYQSTTTELYGNESDPTVWANLELASEPVLDFDIVLEASSTIVDKAEVFYVTCFISNNANSTGIIYNINVTILVPSGITLAPTMDASQYKDSLSSASTHGSGYNYTFLWTLIAIDTGTHQLAVNVDGIGIPHLSNETHVEIVTPSPEIHIISPKENDPLTETFYLQVGIYSQENLSLIQYSLDGQTTWIELIYNDSSSLYETIIDLGSISGNDLSVLAADERNRVTILTMNVSNSEMSSQTIRITIDNTPPTINVINPQNNSMLNGVIIFQVLISDIVGVDQAMFQLDQGPWISLTYNEINMFYEYELDTTLIVDGNHIVAFRASDALGNTHTQETILDYFISVSNPGHFTPVTSATTSSTSSSESTPGFISFWIIIYFALITAIISRLFQKR